jgi:hypothetical protein
MQIPLRIILLFVIVFRKRNDEKKIIIINPRRTIPVIPLGAALRVVVEVLRDSKVYYYRC